MDVFKIMVFNTEDFTYARKLQDDATKIS